MKLLRRLATLWLVVGAVAVAVLTGGALRHPVLSYYAVGVFMLLIEVDAAAIHLRSVFDRFPSDFQHRLVAVVITVLLVFPWCWPLTWLHRFRGLIDIVLAEAEEGSSDEPEGD